MAAAPPHCWPSASAAILFSTEMALAVLGSLLLLSLLLPAVPPSLASRPYAPLVSLATAAAQPPFFLKGRVKEEEEGGMGRDLMSDGWADQLVPRREGWGLQLLPPKLC